MINKKNRTQKLPTSIPSTLKASSTEHHPTSVIGQKINTIYNVGLHKIYAHPAHNS